MALSQSFVSNWPQRKVSATHQFELSGNAELLEVDERARTLRVKVCLSGSDNSLGKIAQGVFLRCCVLIAAAVCGFANKAEVHPSPVLHCIRHNGEALAQVEAADQLVYGVFEGINLLRISVMLGPVCNKLFSSIS